MWAPERHIDARTGCQKSHLVLEISPLQDNTCKFTYILHFFPIPVITFLKLDFSETENTCIQNSNIIYEWIILIFINHKISYHLNYVFRWTFSILIAFYIHHKNHKNRYKNYIIIEYYIIRKELEYILRIDYMRIKSLDHGLNLYDCTLPHLVMRHTNESVFSICISWIALTSKCS